MKGLQHFRVAVGARERRRARPEEERAIGGVEEDRHHVRAAQVPEDAAGAVELAERFDRVGPHSRAGEQKWHGVARVDDIGVRGRRVIAGHAHDRAIGGQRAELGVQRFDRALLDGRILRVARLVSRFQMREDERVPGVEAVCDLTDSDAEVGWCVIGLRSVDRIEPDRAGEAL